MQKTFEELVPKGKYIFIATTGIAHGDGWFVTLTAYVANPDETNKNIALQYESGITADSTIDSSLYDASMTYATERLVLIKIGRRFSKWFWEKDETRYRRLSKKEFSEKAKELMKLIRNAELPCEKIKSLFKPPSLYWRLRDQ